MLLIAAWMLTYVVHSTLLLGILAFSTPRFPRKFESLLESIWRAALIVPVISATMHTVGNTSAASSYILPTGIGDSPGRAAWFPSLPWPGIAGVDLLQLVASIPVMWFLVAGTLLVSAVRILRFGAAHRSLRSLLADRRVIDDAQLRSSIGLSARHRVRISTSRRIATPLTIGFNEICLPWPALLDFTPQELDAVLAHEVAHVERRDNAWLFVSTVLERALWFQPLARIALTRLHTLSEYQCDDFAVHSTGSGQPLASALVRVGEWMTSPTGMRTVSTMVDDHALSVRRVERLLGSCPASTTTSSGVQLVVGIVALVATVSAAPRIDLSWRADDGRLLSLALSRAPDYTVNAHDDAGPFTVTLSRGRVVAMTIDNVPVDNSQLVQRAERVHVGGVEREGFVLTLKADGGFTWQSRKRPVSTP